MINDSESSTKLALPNARLSSPSDLAPLILQLTPHAAIDSPSKPKSKPISPAPAHSPCKTKIIVPISQENGTGEVWRLMLQAGVSIFSINPSRIERESVLKAVYAIRSISAELHRPVSLILDARCLLERIDPSANVYDNAFVRFGIECGVDWIVVSTDADGKIVGQVRQFLADQKRNNIGILAQIASPVADASADGDITDADGIVIEHSSQAKSIVQKCVSMRKLVVVATDSRDPSVTAAFSPRPDALLLAEETTSGSTSLESVQIIAERLRQEELIDRCPAAISGNKQNEAVELAIQQAEEIGDAAIVVFTRLGNTAYACAALRPHFSPVFAFTPDVRLARRLRLRYAIEPVVLSFFEKPERNVLTAEKILLERGLIKPGTKIVFITDSFDVGQRANSIQVRISTNKKGKG